MPVPFWLGYYSFVIGFEVWSYEVPSFVIYAQNYFDNSGSFAVPK
jgi:hypothetical protein